MFSKWSDEEADFFISRYEAYGVDIALRVYTTRLLGSDPSLVLHGGGNTSVKTTLPDELGRQVPVLCVKGSGWDMGSIEPGGLPAVCLEPLREFRVLEAMSDEVMVNGVRRFLLDSSSPNPSVETLLHGFLPHKFIDHTHADAILALADQANAVAICNEVFGARMGVVPYIMPGFALSKIAAAIYEQNPAVEGLILVNHGIFTFGNTAREAYERMIDCVTRAEDYIQSRPKTFSFCADKPGQSDQMASCMNLIRGCLSQYEEVGLQILQWRNTARIKTFLDLANLADLASRGPATPDHVIRTKQKPLILENPELCDETAFARQVSAALELYISDYHQYFEDQVQSRKLEKKRVHPLPVVFLVPGVGLITAGKTVKEARIAADIYEHTIDVILNAERVGCYQPLCDDHIFDMEYWSLEQAKLGKSKPAPLAGHVVLVTGACGGIGKATACTFAARGANLVLLDLPGSDPDELALDIARTYGVGATALAVDVTEPNEVAVAVRHACNTFGGLDIVISNAGIATSEPIALATGSLKASLDINLLSHQYLASESVKVMERQGLGGCLLFNASKSAFNPGPGFGAYAIAKAGLVALMKQYAIEFAGIGIRSMAVNADRVRTNLFDLDLLKARASARGLTPDDYFKANLLGREVFATDVADAFLHLFHSQKTTGMVMTVDGGNIAASPR